MFPNPSFGIVLRAESPLSSADGCKQGRPILVVGFKVNVINKMQKEGCLHMVVKSGVVGGLTGLT